MRKWIQDKLGQLKTSCSIRKWFIKKGFRVQEEKVTCMFGYGLQIACLVLTMGFSWYFITQDSNSYPAFILNIIAYFMNIIIHLTKHKKLEKKLAPLGDINFDCNVNARGFYKKFADIELWIMIFVVLAFIIINYYCLPPNIELIQSRVINVFSILFVIICGASNIENVLENMYSVEIDSRL